MEACGASFGSLFAHIDETAVAALPGNLVFAEENLPVGYASVECAIALLVVGLNFCDVAESGCHCGETLLVSNLR